MPPEEATSCSKRAGATLEETYKPPTNHTTEYSSINIIHLPTSLQSFILLPAVLYYTMKASTVILALVNTALVLAAPAPELSSSVARGDSGCYAL
jgi:hypothetical protein